MVKKLLAVLVVIIIAGVTVFGLYNIYWNSKTLESVSFPLSTLSFERKDGGDFFTVYDSGSPSTSLFSRGYAQTYNYKGYALPDPTTRCSFADSLDVAVYACKNSFLTGNAECLEWVKNTELSEASIKQTKVGDMIVWKSDDPHWNDCSATVGRENKDSNYVWAKGNLVFHVNYGENTAELVEAIINTN